MIRRGVLDETLNKSLNSWSQSDTFMQVLVEKAVNDSGFLVTFAASVR